MTTTRDILIAARALIADERNWIKGSFHLVDEEGRDCYCSVGAVDAAVLTDTQGIAALERLAAQVGPYVTRFNDADETTHADVLAMFDRAIEASS